MKAGELKKIAQTYHEYFQNPWQKLGNEFMRCEGDWVQIICFNTSRFADLFVPRSSMEFLKMPGVPTASFLPQELQHANGTQRWLKPGESHAKVFEEMSKQFRPSLHKPLNLLEIRSLLAASLEYWPNAYALSVTACEEGNATDAQRFFNAFSSATADKPYPWAEVRKQELAKCLELAGSPEVLKTHLDNIRSQKLEALKLPG